MIRVFAFNLKLKYGCMIMFLKFLILRTIFGVNLDNVGNILEICVWPILALSRLQQFTKHFKATLLGWRTPLHLFSSGIVRQNTTFWWQQKEEFEPPSLSLYPVDSSRRQTIGNRVTAEKHKTCQESWPKICQTTTRTKGSRKLSKTAKETFHFHLFLWRAGWPELLIVVIIMNCMKAAGRWLQPPAATQSR